ncbi:hypothetical protein HDU80_000489 [Chytriomyces hyalinus]|nr:hypothetical protein HDU80_000489 [Chytriomyces hyalinus]
MAALVNITLASVSNYCTIKYMNFDGSLGANFTTAFHESIVNMDDNSGWTYYNDVAVIAAIDRVNKDPSILPGIHINLKRFSDCGPWNPDAASSYSGNSGGYASAVTATEIVQQHTDVIGVIGNQYSSTTRYVILSGINDFITKAVYKLGKSGLLTDEMVFMSENALHIKGDPVEVYGPDFYDVIRGYIWLPTSPNPVEEPALNVYEYINRELAHAEIPYDYFDEYYMPETYDCAMMMLLGIKKLLEENPEISPKLLGERRFQDKMNWTLFKDLNYSGVTWPDMKLDSQGDLEMPILVSRYTGNYMNRTSFALSDLGFTRFLEYNTSNPIFHNDDTIPPPDGPIISSRSYSSDTFEGEFIIALTATGALLSIASIAFFITFRHDNIAKSASIPECVACLSGCCIGYLSLLFFLNTPTTMACKARVALISTAFGVVVSCLASRSLFIAVIFSTRQVYKNSKALNITHRRFKYCNMLVVALELVLVAAWGYFSKVRVRYIETNAIFYGVCVEAAEKGLSMSFMSAALFVHNIIIYVALLCSLYLQKDVGSDRSDELTTLVITSLIVPLALIIINGLDNTVSSDADFRVAICIWIGITVILFKVTAYPALTMYQEHRSKRRNQVRVRSGFITGTNANALLCSSLTNEGAQNLSVSQYRFKSLHFTLERCVDKVWLSVTTISGTRCFYGMDVDDMVVVEDSGLVSWCLVGASVGVVVRIQFEFDTNSMAKEFIGALNAALLTFSSSPKNAPGPKRMKFVSNLPDQEHVPYKFIAAEPHFKYVMSYMRSSDIVMAGAIGAGFPAAHMVWERLAPTFHPRLLPRLMMIQVPFYASVGFLFACQSSYFRFWGWKENAIEAARWENEASQRNSEKPKGWMDGTDW